MLDALHKCYLSDEINVINHGGCKVRGLEIMSDFMCLCNFIIHYSFSRHFYPKRLTIEEYNKRVIIKRQRDTGSACNTTFQVLFRVNTSRA